VVSMSRTTVAMLGPVQAEKNDLRFRNAA